MAEIFLSSYDGVKRMSQLDAIPDQDLLPTTWAWQQQTLQHRSKRSQNEITFILHSLHEEVTKRFAVEIASMISHLDILKDELPTGFALDTPAQQD